MTPLDDLAKSSRRLNSVRWFPNTAMRWVTSTRNLAEGLAKNKMPVQLTDRSFRVGNQLKISVADGSRFQTVIKKAFGQGVDRGIFATGTHFQRLDQLFVKTALTGEHDTVWFFQTTTQDGESVRLLLEENSNESNPDVRNENF